MAKKRTKRVVLGEGHPWFLGANYHLVCLSKKNASTPIDGGIVPLKTKDLGAWKKVRLVVEYEI